MFSASDCVRVVSYPGEIGSDVQPGQRLADVVAQLGRGGVRVFVVAAGVVEGAVDPAAHLAQVEVQLGHAFLQDHQRGADVLQGLLGFSHGWNQAERR